jgi:ubiquinone/menaquinone biosynthesis C-methylase UbiE
MKPPAFRPAPPVFLGFPALLTLAAIGLATACGRSSPAPQGGGPALGAPLSTVSGAVPTHPEASYTPSATAALPASAPSTARAVEPCSPPPGLSTRRQVAQIMGASGSAWLDRADRERTEPRERILEALHVAPGEAIADVGAGTGYYTLALARRVGPSGRVVATDVQPEMLRLLGAKVRAAGLANVETVLATEAESGLGRAAFDLALMVDVYHELARPFEALAQIRCALKEKGRLVLLEYRAEDPAVLIKPEHKMRAEDVVAEIEPAGFRLGERLEFLPQHHVLVFVKAPPRAP